MLSVSGRKANHGTQRLSKFVMPVNCSRPELATFLMPAVPPLHLPYKRRSKRSQPALLSTVEVMEAQPTVDRRYVSFLYITSFKCILNLLRVDLTCIVFSSADLNTLRPPTQLTRSLSTSGITTAGSSSTAQVKKTKKGKPMLIIRATVCLRVFLFLIIILLIVCSAIMIVFSQNKS